MAEKWQDEKRDGRRNEEERKYWFLISRNDSLKTRSKRKKKTRTLLVWTYLSSLGNVNGNGGDLIRKVKVVLYTQTSNETVYGLCCGPVGH